MFHVSTLYSGASVIFIADYIVEEQEGMAEVCAILSGAINIDITVVLSAQENDQLPLNTRAISKSISLS